MRGWSVGALAGLAVGLAACGSDTRPGVPPQGQPPPNNGCGDMCTPPDPPPVSSAPADPMEFLSVGVDRFGGFFEPVEVVVHEGRVAMCTGVRGLTVYRVEAPCCLSHEVSIIPDRSRNYPRCQHLEFVGDRVYITNHGDEISPDTFVTAVDVSNIDQARTIETVISPNQASYEGIAAREGVAYVAQHEAGVAVFRLEGDGSPTFIKNVTTDLDNAWQPRLDPAGAFLYVADAAGRLVAFDVTDPLDPKYVATAEAEGTLKDIVWLDDTVYAAAGSAGLEVFDARDPARLTKVRRVDTPGSALGVAAEGKHLVIADWNDVQLFDISERTSPVLLGHQKAYDTRRGPPSPEPLGRILDVALDGDLVYMAEWAAPQVHRIIPDVDAPDIFVASAIELLRTEPGDESAVGLGIQNLGRWPLNIQNIEIDPPFSVSVSGREVTPGRRQLAEIVFSPETPAEAQSTLRIETDDPDEPVVEVLVRANLPGLRPGDRVQDFSFVTLDGEERRLSDFSGRPVLLAYFATF